MWSFDSGFRERRLENKNKKSRDGVQSMWKRKMIAGIGIGDMSLLEIEALYLTTGCRLDTKKEILVIMEIEK